MTRSRIVMALALVACGQSLVEDVSGGGEDGADAGAEASSDGGPLVDGGSREDANPNTDAGPRSCKPTGPFTNVKAIPRLDELGEVSSLRPERDSGLAMAAIDAGTSLDVMEGELDAGAFYSVLSAGRGERSPAPLDDGLHLYFEAVESDGGRGIVATARQDLGQNFNGFPQTPEALPVGAGVEAAEPWSVAGKNVLYFTVAPGNNGTRDILRAEKKTVAWETAPTSALATDDDEGVPVVTDDELVMYFARRDVGRTAIYYVTRAATTQPWSLPPTAIADTSVNDATSDDLPTWISPDGCTLFFVSNRSGVMRAYGAVITPTP